MALVKQEHETGVGCVLFALVAASCLQAVCSCKNGPYVVVGGQRCVYGCASCGVRVCVQDVIEIMREGMFDRAPLSGLAGGVPVLDFRKAPGSRGGKAGEAARFIAALRAMANQQDRDTFSTAELQVRATENMGCV